MPIESRMDGQKWVGWISILSFFVCLAAIYAIIAAVQFDASLGYLPVEAIELARPKWVFAWAVFDFLGYYMMRGPLILFLWVCYRSRHPSHLSKAKSVQPSRGRFALPMKS